MDKLTQADAASHDTVADNLDKLKALFPEALTEGKIDFDVLKETLGEYCETREERYNFTWPGKSKARRLAQTPTTGTLRPCPEESADWDTTENLFIEGDNLEVLKLLQKSYQGQVKMIYIDPPYNTGGDFVYPDKYADNLKGYLEYTNQVDAEGNKQSSNTESAGRYHSNWLNMMMPRLHLAKNLLKKDGVIFISIDDNEQRNLRALCDEVFGEESFIAQIIWEGAFKNDARQIGTNHEYALVYSKTPTQPSESWTVRKEGVDPILAEVKRLQKQYGDDFASSSRDLAAWFRANKAKPSFAHRRFRFINARGAYKEDDPTAPGGRRFDLIHPHTGSVIPLRRNRGWSFDQEKFDQMVKEKRISFITESSIMVRRYLHETDRVTPQSVLYQPARSASERLSKLIGEGIFDYPKDESVISQFVDMATVDSKKSGIVLDFFAGSSTTAHSVLDLNIEDGGNRKFIMVQLPELCNENSEASIEGYKTIAEIGKERIRRAAANLKEENPDYDGDLGFKVFKLDSSNIEAWDSNNENLEENVLKSANVLKDNRSEMDIVYELFLKYGLDLSYPVNTHEVADKQVYEIGAGSLFICLEDGITTDFVEALTKLYEKFDDEAAPRVVFKDSGFATDAAKKDAESTLKDAGILDVKCL